MTSHEARKPAEDHLARQVPSLGRPGELHRLILENTSDAVFLTAADGSFRLVSPNAATILGYTEAEVWAMGKIEGLMGGGFLRRVRVRGGEARHDVPWTALAKDGAPHELLINAHDVGVAAAPFLFVCRDVTQRYIVEVTLLESEQRFRAAEEALQALSRQTLAAQEDERMRIARELHDDLGQLLTAAKMTLMSDRQARNEGAVALVTEAIARVRSLALQLRPAVLDDLGLVPAVRWYIRQQADRANFEAMLDAPRDLARMPQEVETACYRIIQEAVTNAARHADPSRVRVGIRRENGTLFVTVADDGRGFDVASVRARARRDERLGIVGMSERAALAGGELEIDSAPGRGTVVTARFPIETRDDDADPRSAGG
jgi:PAS domain S-box-containing protein